ncbi:transglycosylase family protein [Yinghuangia seranimata]|uniref:LysM peptidoglycan-binding domain-containing protein n=1 Tax=Yinghuangia seranimata TaxID=408067 RepID=UPI00248B11CC|nr:transglycosylase family protein [Yinghuangia seranimata]MDI2131967.1 transglycosylase family protein [Yinghuangia seranimata]
MYRTIVRSSAYATVLAALSLLAGLLTAAPAVAVSDTTWDRLAMCESSQRWNIDSGNGYYGGLQILPSTWDEAGGQAYAKLPNQATRREQITVAEKIVRMQGWDAWPQCARQLDLYSVPITTTYVVQPGDTLSSIARKQNVPGGWTALYTFNRDVIGSDPDLLIPGTRIELPPQTKVLTRPSVLPPPGAAGPPMDGYTYGK